MAHLAFCISSVAILSIALIIALSIALIILLFVALIITLVVSLLVTLASIVIVIVRVLLRLRICWSRGRLHRRLLVVSVVGARRSLIWRT